MFQYMLAKFRAYGGRIHVLENNTHPPKAQKSRPDSGKLGKDKPTGEVTAAETVTKDPVTFWERKIDCLDPYRHQRIAVLFNSYSYESENHPSPCVYPW